MSQMYAIAVVARKLNQFLCRVGRKFTPKLAHSPQTIRHEATAPRFSMSPMPSAAFHHNGLRSSIPAHCRHASRRCDRCGARDRPPPLAPKALRPRGCPLVDVAAMRNIFCHHVNELRGLTLCIEDNLQLGEIGGVGSSSAKTQGHIFRFSCRRWCVRLLLTLERQRHRQVVFIEYATTACPFLQKQH